MNTVKQMLDYLSAKGLTDTEIGLRLSVNRQNISSIRRGEQKDTSYATGKKLESLCRAFKREETMERRAGMNRK